MKDFNKKLLTLTAAVILACGIFITGMADTAVGTVVVTREMAADTQRRYTLIVDGVEVPLKEGVYENAILAESEAYGRFGSSSQGEPSDYAYRAALYVTRDGIDERRSVTEVIQGGSYSDAGADGIAIDATSDSFNGMILDGGSYTVSRAALNLTSHSDGSNVNDFTGLGTAIVNANGGKLIFQDSTINTTGVAKLAFLTDSGAATMVRNSTVSVQGGTLYEGYRNNSRMATMVSPPWVLGIGGNARLSNIEGRNSLLAVVDSRMTAGGWGVLSTDSGSDMQIVAVDSEITLDRFTAGNTSDPYLDRYATGYGAFAIGQAQEFFYGTTINAGTYGGVITGGYMTFADSDFENGALDVHPLSGDAERYDFLGHYVTGFSSEAAFKGISGKGQPTILNSDGFGIMTWGSAGVKLTEGTIFNTDEAAFLVKSPDTAILVEGGSQIHVDNGVLLQMIDDENNAVGTDAQQIFDTQFTEAPGWPSENGGVTDTSNGGYVTFTVEDAALEGNLYNGTGYHGQNGRSLVIFIGRGASLRGDISATEVIHVNERYDGTNALEAQNTRITSDRYYYIGRVANREYFNGNNFIQVTVRKGGEWRPQKASLITYLQIEEGGSVYADIRDNGDGTYTLTPSGNLLTDAVFGQANELVQVKGGFSFGPGGPGGFDPSMMPGFDPSTMGDFDPSQMPGFDPSKMGDFDPSTMPGFDPSQMGDFDPSQFGNPPLPPQDGAPGK